MEFNIIDEKNEFKLGNIISIFKLPDDDREIALFSVSDFDGDESSLNVAYIKTDREGYDYIEEIEDEKISSVAKLRYELYKHNPGDTIKVTYNRDGKENTAEVTLEESK